MLLQAYGSEPGYAFAVVDKELHPRVSIESSKCMYTENYVNGDLLIKDVYIEEGVALDKKTASNLNQWSPGETSLCDTHVLN